MDGNREAIKKKICIIEICLFYLQAEKCTAMKENKAAPVEIDSLALQKAALQYRAINHKLRQQILQLLHKNSRMMVTSIYVKLRIEQSVASQHLAILRRAKLVTAEREGKSIYYSVNYPRLVQLHSIAEQLTKR